MAHCRYEELEDLEGILVEIRSWEGIREPKPGIFYLGGKGFLHFHSKGEERWADIRAGRDWGTPVGIPRHAPGGALPAFLGIVRERYLATRAWKEPRKDRKDRG